MTLLASWFIADTHLDWLDHHPRDPALLAQLELDVLPLLSVGNVYEFFRAALPLPLFSLEKATTLVCVSNGFAGMSRKLNVVVERTFKIRSCFSADRAGVGRGSAAAAPA